MNGITDADPADHQSGEADQSQKQAEAFDETAHGGRGIAAVAQPPSGQRKPFLCRADHCLDRTIIGIIGQTQAIVIIDERTGAQKTGRF